MLQTVKLLLPALIPSWRFFSTIAPSPRIEFALLATPDAAPVRWQEFRPRPGHLTIADMLRRMFWNPGWNESLFLVSCAERLMKNPTEHSSTELMTRIKAGLNRERIDVAATPYFLFRLVFVDRHEEQLHKHITYLSKPHPL